ncbi:hypothetical protein LXA43DRAFT_1097396 [Ganoderma leucocontextum]|nr:hypothetical protein LXA43DRAFT_1099779 [Ganoderma leucocontextum]KAI1788287.1 hypothetical protein LXA43DRAFT_1097396 [Ganoderma leucocontextum]
MRWQNESRLELEPPVSGINRPKRQPPQRAGQITLAGAIALVALLLRPDFCQLSYSSSRNLVSQMARTKQTARVSTGGKAPRASLQAAPPSSDLTEISSTEEEDSSKRRKQPLRQMSTKRAKTAQAESATEADPDPEPQPHAEDTAPEEVPVCTTWRMPKEKEPTEGKPEEEKGKNQQPTTTDHRHPPAPQGKRPQKGKQPPKDRPATPYFGLYRLAPERPFFATWVELKMTSSRPQHSQVDTRPLIILNVRLATLREKSSPARLLYHLLTPWFNGAARECLRYIDLPFNVTREPMAAQFRARVNKHLNRLGPLTNARIVLFIYTHSHDEAGDLYYGDNYSSPSVGGWWKDMITPKLAEIATTGNNKLCVGMLTCGALIMQDVARTELISAIKGIHATHTFAFSTKELQPSLTTLFFYSFAHHVLIEGAPLTQLNIATLLDQAVFIARHTPLFHFYLETKTKASPTHATEEHLTVVEYKWTHDTMRPDGKDIGLQCPGCGSLGSRVGKKKVNGKKDRCVVVWCKMTDCKWEQTYTIAEDVRDLKTGENGLWTARPLSRGE